MLASALKMQYILPTLPERHMANIMLVWHHVIVRQTLPDSDNIPQKVYLFFLQLNKSSPISGKGTKENPLLHPDAQDTQSPALPPLLTNDSPADSQVDGRTNERLEQSWSTKTHIMNVLSALYASCLTQVLQDSALLVDWTNHSRGQSWHTRRPLLRKTKSSSCLVFITPDSPANRHRAQQGRRRTVVGQRWCNRPAHCMKAQLGLVPGPIRQTAGFPEWIWILEDLNPSD